MTTTAPHHARCRGSRNRRDPDCMDCQIEALDESLARDAADAQRVITWTDERGAWYVRAWTPWGAPPAPRHGPFGTEAEARDAIGRAR